MSGLIFCYDPGPWSYYLLHGKLSVELLQFASSPAKTSLKSWSFLQNLMLLKDFGPTSWQCFVLYSFKMKGFRHLLLSAKPPWLWRYFPCVDKVNYLSWTSIHISMIVSEWIIKLFIMYSELDKNYCSTKMKNCWGEKNNCLT